MSKTTFPCEKIKNVKAEGIGSLQWISFQVENISYKMGLQRNVLLYLSIFHENLHESKNCPYCEGNSKFCKGITHYNQEIFRHLIKQPNIRLRWLLNEETKIEK